MFKKNVLFVLFIVILLPLQVLASEEDIEDYRSHGLSVNVIPTIELDEYLDGSSHNLGSQQAFFDSIEKVQEQNNRPLKVLSIDGGGIRGIIPLFFLVQLEEKIGKRCFEVFDVLAGTSTGGMIALALSIGTPAKDILDLYVRRSNEIFERRRCIFGPKYKSAPREKIFKEFFGDRMLSDAKVPVLVTAFDIERNKAFRLCSQYPKTKLMQKQFNMRMCDAALATSAAPTYFAPHHVCATDAGQNIELNLIDGGVFANNPVVKAMCYGEALNPYRCRTNKAHILSLGTGYKDYTIPARRARVMTKIAWALKLFPILLNSPSGSADDDMDLLLGENYDRITTFLDYADKELDKAGANIGNLLKDAKEMIVEHEESLEKWTKILLNQQHEVEIEL